MHHVRERERERGGREDLGSPEKDCSVIFLFECVCRPEKDCW